MIVMYHFNGTLQYQSLFLYFQWLFPILLVMITYLSTWTISDPPPAVEITDQQGLKFKQCHYGWWDHCVAIGVYLSLMVQMYMFLFRYILTIR